MSKMKLMMLLNNPRKVTQSGSLTSEMLQGVIKHLSECKISVEGISALLNNRKRHIPKSFSPSREVAMKMLSN